MSPPAVVTHPKPPRDVTALTLAAQYSLPPLSRFPPITGLPFGGLSGLAWGAGGQLLGISDAQQGGRVYTLQIDGVGDSFRVTPVGVIHLAFAAGEDRPDHEAITVLPDGHFLVASEGTTREPRLPPSVAEYGAYGQFVRRLAIPEHYVPEPTGTLTRGARGNAGFESLTLSPDGARLFTASETALIQDGATATFENGSRTRILEFRKRDDTFEPAREFVYDIEAVDKPPYKPGLSINGLVDLLAINRTTLLALERGYVEDAGKTGPSVNRVRLYRITLDGATDVSRLPSLQGQTGIVPVSKTLLLDLSKMPGLSPDLAPSLDNFEGMTFGPALAGGNASLLLVSDDNFSKSQRTWFLLFAIK